ncbi:hypothetical protein JQM83_14500 [Parabacteroides distasonis]|nr:hypothetical protein [Parabacteroides distasonis]MDD7722802.1 hypothetical protein [bacterium]
MGTNKSIHFTYLSVIGCIVLCLLIMIPNHNTNDQLIESLKKDSFNYNQLVSIILEQFAADNQKVNKDVLLMNSKGQTIPLSDIILNNNKFIIRFNGVGCNSCIRFFNDNMHNINEMIESIGNENVIIVMNTMHPREINSFINKHQIKCNVYGLPIGNLSTLLEKQETVIAYYFCTVTKDMVLENCFINIQDWPERTEAYFKCIKRKFYVEN